MISTRKIAISRMTFLQLLAVTGKTLDQNDNNAALQQQTCYKILNLKIKFSALQSEGEDALEMKNRENMSGNYHLPKDCIFIFYLILVEVPMRRSAIMMLTIYQKR
jgi:hypothetical protein